MPFIVEDGTGLVDSNSYADVEEMRDFFSLRGIDLSIVSDANMQAGLVNATDYVDKRFASRFVGYIKTEEQALQWPRVVKASGRYTYKGESEFYDYGGGVLQGQAFTGANAIPKQLKRGVFEYARVWLDLGDLLPLPASPFSRVDRETGELSGGTSGRILATTSKVGPIEDTVQYEGTRAFTGTALKSGLVDGNNIPEYPPADLWIEYLLGSSMTMNLRRA